MSRVALASSSGAPTSSLLTVVHISKCGGSSFCAELKTWLLGIASSNSTSSHTWKFACPESCAAKTLHDAHRELHQQRKVAVTLLRLPRTHVLSQYMECAYSAWGMSVVRWAEARGEARMARRPWDPAPAELAEDFGLWVENSTHADAGKREEHSASRRNAMGVL